MVEQLSPARTRRARARVSTGTAPTMVCVGAATRVDARARQVGRASLLLMALVQFGAAGAHAARLCPARLPRCTRTPPRAQPQCSLHKSKPQHHIGPWWRWSPCFLTRPGTLPLRAWIHSGGSGVEAGDSCGSRDVATSGEPQFGRVRRKPGPRTQWARHDGLVHLVPSVTGLVHCLLC